MQGFITFLEGEKFRLRGETPSDGNGFFEALSDQMQRLGLRSLGPSQLRELTCNHNIDNLSATEKHQLQNFIPGSLVR